MRLWRFSVEWLGSAPTRMRSVSGSVLIFCAAAWRPGLGGWVVARGQLTRARGFGLCLRPACSRIGPCGKRREREGLRLRAYRLLRPRKTIISSLFSARKSFSWALAASTLRRRQEGQAPCLQSHSHTYTPSPNNNRVGAMVPAPMQVQAFFSLHPLTPAPLPRYLVSPLFLGRRSSMFMLTHVGETDNEGHT